MYISRHDNALKCFVWPLLKTYKLVDKAPNWNSSDKVKPYYCDTEKKTQFWWDSPEYTGHDNEPEHPLRPDGKIIIDGLKKVLLIEMTVPWISNRIEKLSYKNEKYKRIQERLKFEHQSYEIDQITLVMDVFGGYGKDLIENIKKVIKDERTVNNIVKNMQKSIISSAAHLSRTFKIRTNASH